MYPTVSDQYQRFEAMSEAVEFVNSPTGVISYVSGEMLCPENGHFEPDGYMGGGMTAKFSTSGLKSVSRAMGFPVQGFDRLSPEMGASVLNHLAERPDVRREIEAKRVVVVGTDDEPTIVGLVSRTYQPYAHTTFLDRLRSSEIALPKVRGDGWKGRMRGTLLEMERTILTVEVESDKTDIGIRVLNSQSGESSLAVEAFVMRLLCLNGLRGIAWSGKNKRRHRGQRGWDVIDEWLNGAQEESHLIAEHVQQLAGIRFKMSDLSRDQALTTQVVQSVPRAKKCVGEFLQEPRWLSSAEGRDRGMGMFSTLIGDDQAQAVFHTFHRQDVSAWDLVNLITAEARIEEEHTGGALGAARRAEIERNAGHLSHALIEHYG